MARAIVNPDLCQGHTLCNFAAPDIFQLRDPKDILARSGWRPGM